MSNVPYRFGVKRRDFIFLLRLLLTSIAFLNANQDAVLKEIAPPIKQRAPRVLISFFDAFVFTFLARSEITSRGALAIALARLAVNLELVSLPLAAILFALYAIGHVRLVPKEGQISGSWAWPALRSWWPLLSLRRWFGYHPIFPTKQGDAEDAKKPTGKIYACYPHGHVAAHAIASFMLDGRGGDWVRILVHDLNFAVPIWRDFVVWLGGIRKYWDVVDNLLRHGRSVAILPDGVYGGMGVPLYDEGHRPYNFLRRVYNAAYDIDVVVVYCPNELRICKSWTNEWHWIRWLRQWSQRRWGKPFFSFFLGPYPWRPLLTYHSPPFRRRAVNDDNTDGKIPESWETFRKRFEKYKADFIEDVNQRLEEDEAAAKAGIAFKAFAPRCSRFSHPAVIESRKESFIT